MVNAARRGSKKRIALWRADRNENVYVTHANFVWPAGTKCYTIGTCMRFSCAEDGAVENEREREREKGSAAQVV